ncbi:MAG: hypothetical protein M1838_000266 [Thelocarpon superellum]|nr:MAG: hypothetical protein M1838_000266 [Thelocarpon superellum]
MDPTDLSPLLQQLARHVDELDASLAPILASPLADTAAKLPLLDKAKLYVLATYALESCLFSYLRLHGVDARQHPVFRELARVKQYFAKIQAVTAVDEQKQPAMTLDTAAAGRVIRSSLAGNDKIDLARAEQQAKERARALLRATDLAKKRKGTAMEGDAAQQGSTASGKKRMVMGATGTLPPDAGDDVEATASSLSTGVQSHRRSKKQKRKSSKPGETAHTTTAATES